VAKLAATGLGQRPGSEIARGVELDAAHSELLGFQERSPEGNAE
jgi:hypothetical protein